MKSSALACYLEAVANAIRATKSTDVPHIKWTAFKGPAILHVGSMSSALPIPDHRDCPDLVCLFPQMTRQDADAKQGAKADAHSPTVEQRNQLADLRCMLIIRDQQLKERDDKLARLTDDAESLYNELSRTKTELASVRADLKAADQTLARMRQGHVVQPAPARPVPPVAPGVDFLSQIIDATANASEAVKGLPRPNPPPHEVPVLVLTFPMNGQGKTLAAAAVTLPELRELFTFHFNDNRDATRGGYWLAKNPTGPHAQELARTLGKEGATVGTQLPLALAR